LIAHTYPEDFKEHNFARNAFRDKILEWAVKSKTKQGMTTAFYK
jgi:hypothetical protein